LRARGRRVWDAVDEAPRQNLEMPPRRRIS
jgi:hypothetical protein